MLISQCSICILTFNRQDQLPVTLKNLYNEVRGFDIEVIILNNGSTDDTSAILSQIGEDWKALAIINSKKNVGCAQGREILWRRAHGKYIISMDDDIIVNWSGLIDMFNLLESTENAGIVSPTILDSKSGRILNSTAAKITIATSFYEGCFAIKSELIDRIGYLDPALFVAGEGLDYSIRLRQAGFKIIRAADIIVEHVDRMRSNTQEEARRTDWVWSFAYLYFKNYSILFAFLKTSKIIISHIRTGLPLFGWKFSIRSIRAVMLGAWCGRRTGRRSGLG